MIKYHQEYSLTGSGLGYQISSYVLMRSIANRTGYTYTINTDELKALRNTFTNLQFNSIKDEIDSDLTPVEFLDDVSFEELVLLVQDNTELHGYPTVKNFVDPKNFSDDNFIERKGPHCIIPPNSFVLAKTVEYFRIPKDVLCICVGKSTYARTGIICNVTPIENEFEGNIVIELSNTTPNPAKIYSNEGIAQFLFFKSDTQPETTYKSKNGKYQGQTTIQVAKIKK